MTSDSYESLSLVSHTSIYSATCLFETSRSAEATVFWQRLKPQGGHRRPQLLQELYVSYFTDATTYLYKERFDDPAEYERLKGSYILTREMVERIRPKLTIMHPLPRVNEISNDVDNLINAAYFRQVKNGVYVRMALIAAVLGKV